MVLVTQGAHDLSRANLAKEAIATLQSALQQIDNLGDNAAIGAKIQAAIDELREQQKQ